MSYLKISILVLIPHIIFAQDSIKNLLKEKEIHLLKLKPFAFTTKNEQQRIDSNKVFLSEMNSILQYQESFNYPFEYIKSDISILEDKDKTFRIITWNLPKNDGTHIYFGFIQRWQKEKETKEYQLYQLTDISHTVKGIETFVGNPQKWFGMLYYQIVDCKNYWLLLGWDGNEKLIQRKFIDVLYFKQDGTPVFGKDVFKIPKKNPRRIMFQYSTDITMSLKYDEKKGKIIFQHLSPQSESPYMKEQYQFYGPDGSVDAYTKDKNQWKLEEDIDARNNEDNYNKSKKPDPKKQQNLYQPK